MLVFAIIKGKCVSKHQKLMLQILHGVSDRNVDFESLRHFLIRLGFCERIKGSHHIFTKSDVAEIINLQAKLGKAKAYQVKQVRELIVEYNLGGDDV